MQNLFAYHIGALVPNPLDPRAFTSRSPQKVNGSKEVHIFSVGTLHGRTLVIYTTKKEADSVFHIVEPVFDKITERPKASSSLVPSMLSRRNKSSWFRAYRDFSLLGECYDVIFLKAKIVALCSTGFEVLELIGMKRVNIPQSDKNLAPIAQRCKSCRPLGMFRCSNDEFLLCYDEFGVHVNKNGAISRAGVIEWEGKANRVALHAPYILLFNTSFIEIRKFDTGQLSQIFPGTEIQCVWDGRGAGSIATASTEGTVNREPLVHAVMNLEKLPDVPARGITQHVFELVPVLPAPT
ncbi:hypothetical protein EST38_g7779 [Candolleomyces aberdarensis]|uniref:CNH domain-containing protein n=1 Tax=Candolleomyces aberdarensis TaxID=2316362 RepID=A0A4Q2DG99_9AGAR|nr:hypothetical protein EST38_g7779 [Candolleomyces aberdarensis]